MYFKENPVMLFAKHRFTGGHIVPLPIAEMGQTLFPVHEYDILVVELPRSYVEEMVSHGIVKAKFLDREKAEAYIAENYNFPGNH